MTSSRRAGNVRALPYVPRLVASWPADLRWQDRIGSLASVDLSGFTALTERLVERGREGAEEINTIVSTIFSALIDVVHGEGGDVLSFGGDAILVWFDGESPPSDARAAVDSHQVRAARCVAELQRTIARIGRVESSCGRVRMSMSVGLHSGRLTLAAVGSPTERRLVTIGASATRTIELESDARAGQVLISAETAAALPARWRGTNRQGRLALRIGAVAPSVTTYQPRPSKGPADVWSFVARANRGELGVLIGEHRLATAAFVKVAHLDALLAADPAGTVAALDAFANRVSEYCHELGVTWMDCDIAADAVKFYLVGGAPVTHEDDEERVLRVCRRLIDDEPQLTIDIGVNSGPVYFADLGHPERRALTSMGDTVNLGARLMGKATDNQIVAAETTLDRTFSTWSFEPLAPFAVKGKRELQRAAVVGHPIERREQHLGDELLGRDRELAIITEAVANAARGVGSTIDICAAAGTGKTALVTTALADVSGMTCLRAVGDPYLAAAPYRALSGLLREWFGADSVESLTRLVRRALPSRRLLMPLVADAFGWTLPDTATSERVANEFRQARTAELIGELVDAAAPSAVLWADDVQWFDEASLSVLSVISRAFTAGLAVSGAGGLLVCTRRPEGARPALHEARSINLRPLTDAAAQQLVSRLALRALHPHVVDAIVDRAGGHPFFLRALTAAVSSSPDSTDASDSALVELPASAERAAAAVLDRLPSDARLLVRHLAVAGKSANLATVAAAMDEPSITDRRRWRGCGEVVEVHDGIASFRHDLYRDAAYHGLAAARRRWLHGRFADVIAVGADDEQALAAAAPALAVHYGEARRYDQAWDASVLAARTASISGAWADADALWTRALSAVRHLPARPAKLRAVLCESAVASERLGRLTDAESRLRRANRLERTVMTTVDIARVMQRQGNSKGALTVCRTALRRAAGFDEIADSSLRLASIEDQLGHPARAVKLALQLLGREDLSVTQRGKASLQAQQSLMTLGDDREAEFGRQAIDLLTRAGGGTALADALNNRSLALWFGGFLPQAASMAEQAGAEYLKLGDSLGHAIAGNNLAGVRLDQGRLDESAALLLRCRAVFVAGNDLHAAACVDAALGTLALRQGRLEDAVTALKEAKYQYQLIGASEMILDADLRLCEVALWQRRADKAFSIACGCLQRSELWSAGGMNGRWARRLRCWARSQLGEAVAARAEADELLAEARADGRVADVAIGLATIEALDRAAKLPTSPARIKERQRLMRRVGIVWAPEPPVGPNVPPRDELDRSPLSDDCHE